MGGAIVYLLDGDTGAVDDMVKIAPAECDCPVYGPYGGAVDSDDNLWTFGQDGSGSMLNGATWGYGPLIFVEHASLAYTIHEFPKDARPGYGIMVDRDDRPWVAGFTNDLYRFDPDGPTWTKVDVSGLADPYDTEGPTLRGIQQDQDGDIWVALAFGYPQLWGAKTHGLLRVDGETATVKDLVTSDTLVGLSLPAGVSIDRDGLVWLVDTLGNQAFRVDPEDYSYITVGGLSTPYTYSDMTGFGLANVSPPEG
jgi:sugar lactone lactonase YvrE